jgi:hypothetical protein
VEYQVPTSSQRDQEDEIVVADSEDEEDGVEGGEGEEEEEGEQEEEEEVEEMEEGGEEGDGFEEARHVYEHEPGEFHGCRLLDRVQVKS